MHRFWKLFLYEVLIYHRSYHMIKNSAFMIVFTTMIFSIMNQDTTNSYNMLITIFGVIISIITTPSYIIKYDMQDGTLENMMVSTGGTSILLIKYFAMLVVTTLGFGVALPFVVILYDFSLHESIYLVVLIILIITQTIALVLLANIVHAYFKKNTNLVLSFLFPLVVPILILSGMSVVEMKLDFLYIIMGIDLVTIPISLSLSNYLLNNIYNF